MKNINCYNYLSDNKMSLWGLAYNFQRLEKIQRMSKLTTIPKAKLVTAYLIILSCYKQLNNLTDY